MIFFLMLISAFPIVTTFYFLFVIRNWHYVISNIVRYCADVFLRMVAGEICRFNKWIMSFGLTFSWNCIGFNNYCFRRLIMRKNIYCCCLDLYRSNYFAQETVTDSTQFKMEFFSMGRIFHNTGRGRFF